MIYCMVLCVCLQCASESDAVFYKNFKFSVPYSFLLTEHYCFVKEKMSLNVSFKLYSIYLTQSKYMALCLFCN